MYPNEHSQYIRTDISPQGPLEAARRIAYIGRKTEDFMTEDVRDNPAESRFELEVSGHLAVAYYKIEGKTITFTHTEVPPALGGQGVGSRLIKGTLEQVRTRGLKVVAQCPFVAAYIGKHKEFGDLID
jgi:predicted GNAT family acetyltransferase